MNELRLDNLSVESRYSKSVAEMNLKLQEIGNDYDRIIFPGHSAQVLWNDMKMTGAIDKDIERKVVTVDREKNKEMYGTEFSQRLKKRRCLQAVGKRSKNILIVDDVLETGIKLQNMKSVMSSINVEADFLILVSKDPDWANTIIISHDQDIRKALEGR